MTKGEFQSLKPGDKVLWNNSSLRTVICGPRWKNGAVKFAIKRRSWTDRAYTTYGYNDVKNKIKKVSGKTNGPILKSEMVSLVASGFNPRKELSRELKEEKDMCERMGRTLCSGWKRLKALSK